jgi:hypothetical protein
MRERQEVQALLPEVMPASFSPFAAGRDRQIRLFGAELSLWTNRFADRLTGLLANRGDRFPLVMGEVAGLFREFRAEAPAVMERGLRRIALWAWNAAADRWARAVPPRVFALRAILPDGRLRESVADLPASKGKRDRGPPKKPVATGAGFEDPLFFHGKADYQRILDRQVSAEEARALIKQFEFPAPKRAEVNAVLNRSAASDGLSAMQRIGTVLERDLERLQRTIASGLSRLPDEGGGSALDRLSQQIRPFIADEEGINYKARRIARTESVRVCESMLREADGRVSDLYSGLRWHSAENACEICDPYDGRVYWRTPAGGHASEAGENLPEIPLHPNCLCWTEPELRADIELLLPAASYSPALAR